MDWVARRSHIPARGGRVGHRPDRALDSVWTCRIFALPNSAEELPRWRIPIPRRSKTTSGLSRLGSFAALRAPSQAMGVPRRFSLRAGRRQSLGSGPRPPCVLRVRSPVPRWKSCLVEEFTGLHVKAYRYETGFT